MRAIEFTVLGVPAPKGSSRAMMLGGRAVNVPSGSNVNRDALKSWDAAVRAAAVAAVDWEHGMDLVVSSAPTPGVFFGQHPLQIQIVFRMRRLKGHFRKDGSLRPDAPKYHITKPDAGKLLRATEDSLKGIVMLDDSHFSVAMAKKIYAAPGSEGAWIRIEQLEDK